MQGRRAKILLLIAGAGVVAVAVMLLGWLEEEPAGQPVAGSPSVEAGETRVGAALRGRRLAALGRAPMSPEERAHRERLQARLERARAVRDRYREATRYPPTARPLSEQPDQVLPHFVSPRRQPLNGADQDSEVRVTLRQSHYYLSGDEAVRLVVECNDSEGPAPCQVLSAAAEAEGTELRADVAFTPAAQDTLHTAVFTPGAQGFADHHGPIHIELGLRVGDQSGGAGFDIEYTPQPPARFTGRVTERMDNGSLVLGVELDVDRAGRYVLAARVDDAQGRSFAYLSFNDMLPRGRTEAPLTLFGKLVLDEEARAPFRLRDVEGFLLLENTFPDRELIPTLEGLVHTTRAYDEGEFSDAEWQSEQRDRYLNELGNDVERAEDALEQAGGAP